jgi:hypothetical protein
MATKKNTKKRVTRRITLPEILQIAEKGYDKDGDGDVSWSELIDIKGKLIRPGGAQDTLVDFLIREIGDFYNPRAGRSTNLATAEVAVHSAIEQLIDVETALLRARFKE